MKKLIFFIGVLSFVNLSFGQVFTTGQTLKPGVLSLGVEPSVLVNGSTEFIMFLHGGIGIKKGIDFSARAGVLGPELYFGGDLEFALPKRMSIAVGAHQFGVFGLDGTWNITFPIKNDIRFTTGVDADVNFSDPETQLLLWIPLSLEIGLKKNMSFIFEAEVGLTDPAYHLIGGGLNFYF